MANPSRVSTITISNAGGSRTWTATAAVQDTAAGAAVTITCATSTTGATPPAAETFYSLQLVVDSGLTVVRTFTPGVGFNGTVSFSFTVDGVSGSAARAGFLRMLLNAVQNQGLAATQYNVSSDGSGGTPPTGYTVTQADSGYIRGTTTAVVTLNAVSYAYGDTITETVTLGAPPFASRTITSAFGGLSAVASSGSTSTVFTIAQGVADNRFPASSGTKATVTTVPNASLVATPWTVLTSITETSATVDPRLTIKHYMQLDTVTFNTPPDGVTDSSHNVTSRLTSQEGDVSIRFTNAAAVGVNGITYTHKINNHANSLQVGYNNTGLVTQTQGGAAGWGPGFSAWASQLSGGAWDDIVTVTGPSNATGLESNGTSTLTLLASDSRLGVLIAISPVAAIEARHLQAGDAIKISCSIFNRDTRMRLNPDAAPTVALIRYDRTNGWQYLATGGTTWTNWGAGTASTFTLTQETDTLSYATTFSSTSGWTATDIVAVQVSYKVNGTPYGLYVPRELVGGLNAHDHYVFDGAGFVGFPSK